MAKDKLTEYDATADNNTVVGDVNLGENSALPSDMNNAIRELMSHLKEFSAGTSGLDVLSFQDDDNSHQLKFQAPSSVTTTTTFTLPDGDGSAGQFLKTDGGGNLSFDSVSGTTINNNADNRVITGSGSANTLEGEANFTFDGSKVGIGASLTPSSALHVSGANNNVASEFRLTAEANQTFKLGANGANLFFTSDHSAPVMFFNRAGTGTAVGGTTMFSVDNNNIQIRTDNQGTTLNGTRGISKCWLTGNGNSQIDAHNTQGYVDHGTGQQTVQVNHNYANANYCISFGSKFSGTFAWLTLQNNPSAGAFRFTMGDRNGGVQEGSRMMAMTMGQSA